MRVYTMDLHDCTMILAATYGLQTAWWFGLMLTSLCVGVFVRLRRCMTVGAKRLLLGFAGFGIAWSLEWPGHFREALLALVGSPRFVMYPPVRPIDVLLVTSLKSFIWMCSVCLLIGGFRRLCVSGMFGADATAPRCPDANCGGRIIAHQSRCAECGLEVEVITFYVSRAIDG